MTPTIEVLGQQFIVNNTANSNTKITMDYTDSLNGSGGWSRVPGKE